MYRDTLKYYNKYIYIYSRRRLKKFEVNLSFMSKGRDENFEIIKSRRLKMMVNN